MKHLLTIFLVACISLSGLSQRGRQNTEPLKFQERLYVGMNIGNISFGTNLHGQGTFNLNLAPYVGFNLIENHEPGVFLTSWSIGGALKFDYYATKYYVSQTRLEKYSGVDLGPTVFTRVLAFDKVFAHLEYERATFQRPVLEPNQVIKQSVTQDYMYVGAGYSTGGPVRFDISIYYNLLDDYDSIRNPFDYRVSVSYHF